MNWFTGIPEILAISLGACSAIGAAMWLAARLPLDHMFDWLLPRAEPAPAAEIDRLAALADLAQREGLLGIEAQLEPGADQILAAGIHMLIEGTPSGRVRRDLETLLDQTLAADVKKGGGRWTRVAHIAVLAAAAFGLVSVWCIGTGKIGAVPPITGLLACYTALLALAFVGPLCDKAFVGAGSEHALSGLMAIESVILIAERKGSAAVRARLTELLPPSGRDSAIRAAA